MSANELDDLMKEAGKATDQKFTEDWTTALEEQQQAAKKLAEDLSTSVGPAAFNHWDETPQRKDGEGRREDINLDVILDVPVTMSMEIGRTKLNIRKLLQLAQGSVVELDRLAGEPMDVLVNGTLIAHGEVVVVNDKFGIRLTDVLSPAERVRKLK